MNSEKWFWGIVLFFIGLLGCTSSPDIVTTQKRPGEAYSADEVRRVTVDQPWLASGDFFRNREQGTLYDIDLGKDSGARHERTEAPPSQAGSRTDAPEPESQYGLASSGVGSAGAGAAAASASPATLQKAGPSGRLLPKVGVVLDPEQISPETVETLLTMLPRAAAGLGIVLADPEKVEEMTARTPCLKNKDLYCLSSALGVYPGIRMLILVESLKIPDSLPGVITARMAAVDTGVTFRYPMMEGTVPVQTPSDVEGALLDVFHKVFVFAENKSGIMPWFSRAFSGEKGEWYLAAGERSGLLENDELRVIEGGKLVKSPTGLPAGWIPGREKGVVRVTRLFGSDFAVCVNVSGEGPGAGDLVMK